MPRGNRTPAATPTSSHLILLTNDMSHHSVSETQRHVRGIIASHETEHANRRKRRLLCLSFEGLGARRPGQPHEVLLRIRPELRAKIGQAFCPTVADRRTQM